ncbi:unnamed protein product, partial [Lampetra planeri]
PDLGSPTGTPSLSRLQSPPSRPPKCPRSSSPGPHTSGPAPPPHPPPSPVAPPPPLPRSYSPRSGGLLASNFPGPYAPPSLTGPPRSYGLSQRPGRLPQAAPCAATLSPSPRARCSWVTPPAAPVAHPPSSSKATPDHPVWGPRTPRGGWRTHGTPTSRSS